MKVASQPSVDTTSAQVCSTFTISSEPFTTYLTLVYSPSLSLLCAVDLLEQPPPSGASSSLYLPDSLFSDVFANQSVAACSEVGVVSLVYGGVGPRLTLNDDQLLASIGCSENTNSSDLSDEIW